MHNTDCPFCDKKILNNAFLETERFLAIYNIAPVLPGHSMVIPKKHITSFMEISQDELFEFVSISRKVIKILGILFRTEAFNWTLQEKEDAGQTIPHMHIHIIPRIPEDLPNPGDWYDKLSNNRYYQLDSDKRPKLDQNEIDLIVKQLRNLAEKI